MAERSSRGMHTSLRYAALVCAALCITVLMLGCSKPAYSAERAESYISAVTLERIDNFDCVFLNKDMEVYDGDRIRLRAHWETGAVLPVKGDTITLRIPERGNILGQAFLLTDTSDNTLGSCSAQGQVAT